MISRDLEPEDFPFDIWVWRVDGGSRLENGVVAPCEWAVTILKPRPGELVPLYIPSFADVGPVCVTTRTAEGIVATTGPYEPRRSNAGA
jgi:hypothetical protein